MGATGIGKMQLGLQFARAGQQQGGQSGILFDMPSRCDAQNHTDDGWWMFDWILKQWQIDEPYAPEDIWNRERMRSDYFHIFERSGRRDSIRDLEPDQWAEWPVELNWKLDQAIA